jgi:molybdopterin-guanine dinucleotide biosynthesis adapter protein
MPHLLPIVGCKNAGKTRTCELLVPLLRGLGLHVGTLKYTEHDGFDWDKEGKDTWRHRSAGSMVTGIFGRRVSAFSFNDTEPASVSIDEMIRVFYRDLDLVLIEGWRRGAGLKIEVCRPGFTDGPVVASPELLATHGVDLFHYDLPHFAYGQENELATHIHGNLDRLRTIA